MHPFHWHPEWRSIKRHRRSNVSFWTPCFSGFSKSQSCEQKHVSTKTMNIFYTPPQNNKLKCNLAKTSCFAKGKVAHFRGTHEAHGAVVLGISSPHPTTEGVKDSWGFGGRLAKAQVSWLKEGDSIRQRSWQQTGGSPQKKRKVGFSAFLFAQIHAVYRYHLLWI